MQYNADDRIETIDAKAANSSGHGGGDFELTTAFVQAVRHREASLAGAEAGLAANVIADAVERARLEMCVVKIAPEAYSL